MIQIGKTSDLVKAKPMVELIRSYGPDGEQVREEIIKTIAMALAKCSVGLGIDIQQAALQMLSEDILEVYGHDSVEDVIYTLKNARQGVYDFGHHKRGVMSMQIISEWMAITLERKAIARENEIKIKQQEKRLEEIDYSKFKDRIEKEKNKEKEVTEKEEKFRKEKAKYVAPTANELEEKEAEFERMKKKFIEDEDKKRRT